MFYGARGGWVLGLGVFVFRGFGVQVFGFEGFGRVGRASEHLEPAKGDWAS